MSKKTIKFYKLRNYLSRRLNRKFEKLGYEIKIDNFGSLFQASKHVTEYNYDHIIEIIAKRSGHHITISYESGVNKDGFNNAVGLSARLLKLLHLKMKLYDLNSQEGV